MALDGGAERDAGMLRARLTATDLANEVAERELEGLWARAWDAAALLRERSEDIEALELLGYAGRKEFWELEGHLRSEEVSHHDAWCEMEAGLRAEEVEAREMEARAEDLFEEVLKLKNINR